MRELAQLMAAAGWAPDSYRDLHGNYVEEKIEMAILHGASVGLGPVAAAQSIAVIEGMPTIWGDGALALVERSGLLEDISENYLIDDEEGLTAVCTVRRRGRPTPIVNCFSMAMAEQARLTEKEGPWQTYPKRMLRMRARSWTIRDGFADVLRGLQIHEEVEDYTGTITGLTLQRRQTGMARLSRTRSDLGPERHPLNGAAGTDAASDDESAARAPPQVNGPRPRLSELKGSAGATAEPAPAGQPAPATLPGSEKLAPDSMPGRANGVGSHPGAAETIQARARGYALVDIDGVVTEYVDAGELRAGFARMLLEQALSPQAAATLWQWNQPGLSVIETRFGSAAVTALRQRLVREPSAAPVDGAAANSATLKQSEGKGAEAWMGLIHVEQAALSQSVQAAGEVPQADVAQSGPAEDSEGQEPKRQGVDNEAQPMQASAGDGQHASLEGAPSHSAGSPTPFTGGRRRESWRRFPCNRFEVDPSWGDRKLFRQYRAMLSQLVRDGSDAIALAQFRDANQALERRLREKLPELMCKLVAHYDRIARLVP